MKIQAVREIALAKAQHLFVSVHLPKCTSTELNNRTMCLVRKWMGLNTHLMRNIIFHRTGEGGLGDPHRGLYRYQNKQTSNNDEQ